MKVIVLVLALVACDNHGSTPDWSRMITQPKLLPFGATSQFADGAAMRPVPAGTITRDWIADGAVRDGVMGSGAPVEVIPIAITRPLLERGRERFEIVCAACHGIAGDGDSAVAHNMQRRRPPSFHEPRLVALSPGELYRTIVDGYGLMPSYAAMISVDDRWAVIAYVRTLQRAWQLDLQTLPPAEAAEIVESLP